MAKTGKVLGQMLRERVRRVAAVLAVELIILAIYTVMWALHRVASSDLMGAGLFGIFAGIASFVILARAQEKVWVENRWRLVPLADWKLYGVSTLANALTMAGAWLVIWLFDIGLWLIDGRRDFGFQPQIDQLGATMFFLVFMLLVLSWSFISLAHMLSLVITDFLPDLRAKWLRGLLTVGIVLIALRLGGWLFRGMMWLVGLLGIDMNASIEIGAHVPSIAYVYLWVAIGLIAVGAMIFSIGCCIMLRRWVETKQPQQVV
ncbi:hypothetical protein [Lacticaseibacillus camelliae]|nr:hypothetical protein [Lacticaseibacillus camelliae]